MIGFGKRKRNRIKYALVSKETKPITVQWAKAEMLHHEGKVGTHALLTQLLYIIYKRERDKEHRNGHRSNRKLMQEQQPHEKQRSQGQDSNCGTRVS